VAEVAAAHPEAYVASAYDDDLVIAGNSTLGEELARLPEAFDRVLAPVGGGGLTAGILVGLRRAGHAAELWGAEPALADDAARSLRAGELVANDGEPQTLADGARTPSLGRRNWEILRGGIAGIVEVPEAAIAEALRLLFADANLKTEPTGALGIGALLASPERFRGGRTVCVISGGNVDPDLYCRLLQGGAGAR
jgi:threonine dehydratase